MSANTLTGQIGKLIPRRLKKEPEKGEEFYRAGQWQLVWWKFRRHKLANLGLVVLGIFYIFGLFAEFMAPYQPLHRFKYFVSKPPPPSTSATPREISACHLCMASNAAATR